MTTPKDLLELLCIAADAKTDEEKARVAWRANDYMWWNVGRFPAGFCREFNNLCPDFPRIKTLWTREERMKYTGMEVENEE
jgi:hypothetical protein